MRPESRRRGAFIAVVCYASIATILYTGTLLQSKPHAVIPNDISKANDTPSAHNCDCPFETHDFIKHRKWNWGTEKYLFRPIGWESVCQEAPGCCHLQIQVARAQVVADIEKKGEVWTKKFHEERELRLEECEYELREMMRCEH